MTPVSSGYRAPRSRLRRVGGRTAARTPFALLVVALLAFGLIALLMLNTALDQGSFALSRLQRQTSQYTQEQQSLQQQIDRESSPDELARRARSLGMVPGGDPAFLTDGGRVLGRPSPLPGTAVRIGGQLPGAVAAPVTPGANAGPSTGPGSGASPGIRPRASASADAGSLSITASTPAATATPTPTPTVVH